jgi:hypothetical protein
MFCGACVCGYPGRGDKSLCFPHIPALLGIHPVMHRYLFGRDGRTERVDRYSRGRWRRRWPRSRAGGCLMWILILVVVLVVLALMFGGFQKGAKVNGFGPVVTAVR